MKRTLLLSLTLCMGISIYAQDKKAVKNTVSAPNKVKIEPATVTPNAGSAYYPAQLVQKSGSALTVIAIGNAANAFGAIGQKTELWADPRINTVTYVHRATAASQAVVGPGSGFLWYDVSKNQGATWDVNLGPIYSPTGASPARYPQGVIYNPPGNTNPNDAYLSYHAPTLIGTNGGSWGGLAYGVQKLDGVTPPTQTEDDVVNNPGYWWQVPFNMTITQDGEIWMVDTNDSLDATSVFYLDQLWIAKGTHSAGDVTYSRTLISAPASSFGTIGTPDIAFGSSGTIGYIGVYGHMDAAFEPDSVFYLIVFKTIDGGATWGSPIQINVSSLVDPILGSAANGKYTTGFEIDLAVDMNDNLHIFTSAGPGGGFSIETDPGMWGLFDFHTTNGGTSWDAMLIAKPMNFRGIYDPGNNDIAEDNRPQIAKTMDGSKLFYVYFDTDSLIATENTFPDAWAMGYDVVTGGKTLLTNLTVNTSADAIVSFGSVAHWVFEPANGYEIPIAFQLLDPTASATDMTQFYYIDDAIFLASDFTSVNEISSIASAGIYPNPFSQTATIKLGLTQAANITLTITNTLGMKIMESHKGKLPAGTHDFEINRSNLSSGMYFYSIMADDQIVTKKMIVK